MPPMPSMHATSLALLLAGCPARQVGEPPGQRPPDDSGEPTDTAGPETIGSPCDERSYPDVAINEVVSASVRGLTDEDGDSSDWIELINLDDHPVDLSGWFLSDDPDDPRGWALPAATTIEPGGLLLVFASSKDRAEGELHADFGLDALGEPAILAADDGCVVDQAEPGRLYRDVSYGRKALDPQTWGYFVEPTPGAPNTTESRPGFAPTPVLEPASGFYDHPVSVSVSAEHAGATLRITRDASLPGEPDELVTGPLSIDASSAPVVLRARAWVDGLWPSRTASAFYSQDPSILEQDLKVVSLTVTPFDLFDVETGIYAYGPPDYTPYYPYFGANFWEDWERDLHISIWEPDGTLVIDQDAGVKIHGGYTRAFEQKSFRVLARTAYGPDELAHRFFPKEEQDSFAVMVLEGVGDWCPTHTENAFIDELFRDQDGARFPTIDSQAWEPCVVYLNGVFWGLYAFREKLDEHYLQAHHEVDPDNLDRVECTADGTDDWWRVSQGDWQAFDDLNSFVHGRDFSIDANYQELAARYDLDNLATAILAEGYWGNTDWWGNNLKFWRERREDARWRTMVFDLGHGWPSYAYDHFGVSVGWSGDGLPIADALENEAFRVLLANQGAELLATAFQVETALERLDSMHARIAPVIPAQYATWCGQPASTWESNVAYARDFVQLRPRVLQAQIMNHLGLEGTADLTLAADPPGAGSFQLTLVEVDPPFTGALFTGIPITVTALPAQGYGFAGWSDSDLGSEPTAVFELDGPRTITARFE
jgi:hypothetical protein